MSGIFALVTTYLGNPFFFSVILLSGLNNCCSVAVSYCPPLVIEFDLTMERLRLISLPYPHSTSLSLSLPLHPSSWSIFIADQVFILASMGI